MSELKRYKFDIEVTDDEVAVGAFSTDTEGNWMWANNVDVVLAEYRVLMEEAATAIDIFCDDVPAAYDLPELVKRLEEASDGGNN